MYSSLFGMQETKRNVTWSESVSESMRSHSTLPQKEEEKNRFVPMKRKLEELASVKSSTLFGMQETKQNIIWP